MLLIKDEKAYHDAMVQQQVAMILQRYAKGKVRDLKSINDNTQTIESDQFNKVIIE